MMTNGSKMEKKLSMINSSRNATLIQRKWVESQWIDGY